MGVRPTYPVGIIYSQSGPYDHIGRSALAGALDAVDAVNADESLPFTLQAIIRDPRGDNLQYAAAAAELIRMEGCRHIVGTITSSSRKDVLPVVERSETLLWYAFPYEGYETSDRVLYLGATANQHIVPMFDYALPRFGHSPYLVGSNYIWGWEMNRIARELVAAAGGAPLGESCVALGVIDVGHLVDAIAERRPDFVLSNLIGPSSHAFIRAYAELGRRDPDFAPDRRPIVSCNLSETDTRAIGPDAAGVLTTALYFDAASGDDADALRSQCYVCPQTAIRILAECIAVTGSDDPVRIRQVATATSFQSPYGPITLDAQTGHCHLRPYFGKASANGSIAVLHRAEEPIAPDPYLVRHFAERAHKARAPRHPFHLKVVR